MEIKIYLDINRKRNKGFPVVIYIYCSKTDKKIKTLNFFSSIEDWNFESEEPKPSHPNYLAIIDDLYNKRTLIRKILFSKSGLTAEQVYNSIFGIDDDFYLFWEQRINEMKIIENRQKDKIKTSGGNSKFYLDIMNIWKKEFPILKFSDINYNTIQKFKLIKEKKVTNNTLYNYLRAPKAIYKEAVKRGLYKPELFISPFDGCFPKRETTRDKYLTLNEMRIIWNAPNKHKYYPYFMLSFLLCGLDYIDIANVRKDQIKNNRLKFGRYKGNDMPSFDSFVPEEAKALMAEIDNGGDYIFPVQQFSYRKSRDRYTNEFRKWLISIGVKSYFSSKSARYTFINLGKQLGLNRDVIIELTAHSRNDVHSIYEGSFSYEVRDEVHRKIIDAIKEKPSEEECS